MGSSSQSPPTETTSVQTTELPDFVKGPAQRYLARAEDLSSQPFTAYQGERVAPLNTFHQAALDGGRQAISTMLPGSMNVMNQFAQGAYNSPAYIHPFLGPQLPGAGLMPTGYTGSPGAGFQGYSPFPQAPMPAIGTDAGAGGKGGMIAAPTPVELAPVPEGLQLIANNPSARTFGGLTAGQIANPTGYATQPTQQQLDQAARNQLAADFGMDDQPLGDIAYYDNISDWASNLRTPMGALAQVAYNVATDAPNTPYLVQNQDTGQLGWSDGVSVMDDFAISPSVVNQDTGSFLETSYAAPAAAPAMDDFAISPSVVNQDTGSFLETSYVAPAAPAAPAAAAAPTMPVWVDDGSDAGGFFVDPLTGATVSQINGQFFDSEGQPFGFTDYGGGFQSFSDIGEYGYDSDIGLGY